MVKGQSCIFRNLLEKRFTKTLSIVKTKMHSHCSILVKQSGTGHYNVNFCDTRSMTIFTYN